MTEIPKEIKQGLEKSPNNPKKVTQHDPVKYNWCDQEPSPCNGCGELVQNRIVTIKRSKTPAPHWRVKCTNCGRHYDNGVWFYVGNINHYYKKKFGLD